MLPPAKPLDLLVVAPHPDDAEISVGGILLRAKQDGLTTGVLELTTGEPTPYGSEDRRAAETAAATDVLGLDWRENLRLTNRCLVPTLDHRHRLAGVFRLCRPALILCPYWDDAHPDHVAACRLVEDARFWSKLSKSDLPGTPFHPPRIYYYWSIHLRIHPQPACVIDVSDAMEGKIQAIRCYESQMIEGRSTEHPTLLDDIRDRARYWGWSIGTSYGEPLGSRETLGLRSVKHLW